MSTRLRYALLVEYGELCLCITLARQFLVATELLLMKPQGVGALNNRRSAAGSNPDPVHRVRRCYICASANVRPFLQSLIW